jgi:putative metallopeptidase DUF4344
LISGGAFAQDMRPQQIDIEYAEAKSAALQPVHGLIVQARTLEKIRDLLAPLRLPRRLLIKTDTCGEANAWYESDTITVCYEYLDEFWKNVPARPTTFGIAPIDALVGPTIDLFLHEVGHAVFDYWGTPVLGREEDAADQFSAFIMLKFEKADARRLIMGNAYQYKSDVRSSFVVGSLRKFSDVHGTPAQRYYNVLCLAYGADQELFADFVTEGLLPRDRADGCKDEYRQVANAFEKLVRPNVDQALAAAVFNAWALPPADQVPRRWRR